MQAENIGPADELADIRAQIKKLEAREAALRLTLIHDPAARVGKRYIAEIVETKSTRVDLKELRAMFPDEVAQHTFPAKTTLVRLRPAEQEAA